MILRRWIQGAAAHAQVTELPYQSVFQGYLAEAAKSFVRSEVGLGELPGLNQVYVCVQVDDGPVTTFAVTITIEFKFDVKEIG